MRFDSSVSLLNVTSSVWLVRIISIQLHVEPLFRPSKISICKVQDVRKRLKARTGLK